MYRTLEHKGSTAFRSFSRFLLIYLFSFLLSFSSLRDRKIICEYLFDRVLFVVLLFRHYLLGYILNLVTNVDAKSALIVFFSP